MSDPKRWKETEEEGTQAFVEALSSREPSPEVRESVWQKLAVTLPPEPGSGSSEGGAEGGGQGQAATTQTVASASGIGKAAGLAIAIVGVGAVVFFSLSPPTPASTAIAASPTTSPPPSSPGDSKPSSLAPTAAASTAASELKEPPRVLVPTSIATPRPHASAPGDAGAIAASEPEPSPEPVAPIAPVPPIAKLDPLREEAEGVRKAQRLLRERDTAAALAELDRLERRFPAGPLAEEREVLTIEALFVARNEDAASKRAERYLFEHSQSMHAARVRRLLSK